MGLGTVCVWRCSTWLNLSFPAPQQLPAHSESTFIRNTASAGSGIYAAAGTTVTINPSVAFTDHTTGQGAAVELHGSLLVLNG